MASLPPLATNPPTSTPLKGARSTPLLPRAKAIAPGNVTSVVLGTTLFKTWYPSFYPEELVGRDVARLHVCRWCFRYAQELDLYLGHIAVCEGRLAGGGSPPGRKIYEDEKGGYAVWEVDGEEEGMFAQNLSLFAKLFLDTKSVFFDVGGFRYYLLVKYTPGVGEGGGGDGGGGEKGDAQIVGFFSKEKMSWDDNNLACILVFPPWQRQGLGKVLMGVSYELSRREGRIGGPEKPLSELGRKGYLRFWEARVAKVVLEARAKSSLTLEAVAERSWMLVDDVMAVLREMGVLEVRKGGKGDAVVNKEVVRRWVKERQVVLEPPVRVSGFLEVGGEE